MKNYEIKDYDKIIKEHYDHVALKDKDKVSCTMDNDYVRDEETKFITKIIKNYLLEKNNSEIKNINIMDVGCGNGYTIDVIINNFKDVNVSGLEYNDSLLNLAKKKLSNTSVILNSGDIRDQNSFDEIKTDIIVCQRVLINLLNYEDQKIALKNIVNSVKKDGILIFIECLESGLNALNKARAEFKLDPMPPAHHNLYISDDFFNIPEIEKYDFSEENQLSTHYYVSRVLHQSFIENTGQKFFRNSEFVSFFTNSLSKNVGNYSPIKFMSFKKIK
tara:strand:- start:95 stop:919 length:825 start_codon:yes stop_codon:yes gene_type:complete